MAMVLLESFHSFLTLFLAVLLSLAFTYHFILRLPPGLPRLSFLLPLFLIFILVPWSIPNYHLRAVLSFIFLWILPSKLLLLCCNSCFDFYPLSPSSSGFVYFVASVLLPIRISGLKLKHLAAGSSDHSSGVRNLFHLSALVFIFNLYCFRERMPMCVIYILYEFHVYLGLQVVLGALAKLARASFDVEVDPQFDNPFMAASLSEFWGRRWNLVVTAILRSTVYVPTLSLLRRSENETSAPGGTPNSKDFSHSSDRDESNTEPKMVPLDMKVRPSSRSRAIATLVTFLVSGLAHELIFFFISKSPATGHVTAFFLLHGLATAVESFLRGTFRSQVRLPRVISTLCTLTFVYLTSVWLFLPPLTRALTDIHVIAEYHQLQSAVVALFVKREA